MSDRAILHVYILNRHSMISETCEGGHLQKDNFLSRVHFAELSEMSHPQEPRAQSSSVWQDVQTSL
jgi:hypothetical protein